MAAVRGARPRKRRAAGTDEATEHLESEGDRLIKHLVDKQLNTNLSLQEQLRCERQYERRLEVGALSCGARGQTSWQQFQDRERWAELRSRGLSEDEASLLCGRTRPCLEGRVARERLVDIQHRLQPAPQEASHHGRATRLELEMAGAEKASSRETRLYQFALSCRPIREDTRPPHHPIHHLRALEQQLLERVSWRQVDPRPAVPCRAERPARCSCGGTAGSGWDVRCACRVESRGAVPGVRSCKPQRLYTVREGRIVALEEVPTDGGGEASVVGRGGEPFVGACPREGPEPRPDRLSVDRIRRLPRFCDYRPGQPSQVLFIKNLQRSVKEEDLVSLFGRFQDQSGRKLTYRLMTGRMRGQAFVTFPSVEGAAAALEAVNGVVWRGQPLVIQFGRSPPGSTAVCETQHVT